MELQPWVVLYRIKHLDPTDPHLVFTCMARDPEDAVRNLFNNEAEAGARNRLMIIKKFPGAKCVAAARDYILTPSSRRTMFMLTQMQKEFANLFDMPLEPTLKEKAIEAIARMVLGQGRDPGAIARVAEIVITSRETVRDTGTSDDDWRSRAVPAPEQAAHAASFVNDQYRPGEPGHADAKELQWWLVKGYPIARLNDAPDAKWFREEQQMWADEGQPNRYDDMLDRPIDVPIVVYDTPTGGWLWDGNHRVGACAVRGIATIPAVVGMHRDAMKHGDEPGSDATAKAAGAESGGKPQAGSSETDTAALNALLMDTLVMLRDLKNDWPWKELANSYEDVVARAKALGLPVDEIEPL